MKGAIRQEEDTDVRVGLTQEGQGCREGMVGDRNSMSKEGEAGMSPECSISTDPQSERLEQRVDDLLV